MLHLGPGWVGRKEEVGNCSCDSVFKCQYVLDGLWLSDYLSCIVDSIYERINIH